MRYPILVNHRHMSREIVVHVELRGTALLGSGRVSYDTGNL